MSYKTQRCRHFDNLGFQIRPYCPQGPHCRFIHPNDPQWDHGKARAIAPLPGRRDKVDLPPKCGYGVRPISPSHRHLRLPPGLPRNKREDEERYGSSHKAISQREWKRDDSHSPGHRIHERDPPPARPYERIPTLRHPPMRSEDKKNTPASKEVGNTQGGPRQEGPRQEHTGVDIHQAVIYVPCETGKAPPDTTGHTTSLFYDLTKVCTKIINDTCTLAIEEDKLKAFTDLSSKLSQVSHGGEKPVTPALAAVISNHGKCKEQIGQHIQELETLWASLFASLENEITKVIDNRMKAAVATLHREKEKILHSISNQRLLPRTVIDPGTRTRSAGETMTRKDGRAEALTMDHDAESTIIIPGPEDPPAFKRRRTEVEFGVRQEDMDLGLKELLQAMKVQMDKQTEAIERFTRENQHAASQMPPAVPY